MGPKTCPRRRFLVLGAAGAAALPLMRPGTLSGRSGSPTRRRTGPAPNESLPAAKNGNCPFSLGVASYSFRAFGLEAAVTMTKRLGLSRICLKDMHLPLESPPADIAACIGRVRGAGLVAYGCGVVYMATPAEVDRAFAYAKAAGMKLIVGVPEHELLGPAQKAVRETGIRLAIHNHGPGDRRYPTPMSVLERVKDMDPGVGLCLDVGHCMRSGMDPAAAAEACFPRLFDVHLKDVTEASANGGPVEVGRGVIDIPRLLRTLVSLGYAGTAAFEYEKDENDPLPGLAESVGYVRGVLAAL